MKFFVTIAPTARSRGSTCLFDLVFDGQLDATEEGSELLPLLQLRGDVAVQDGLHLLCVPAQIQHPHHKVLALHRQLAIVILRRKDAEKQRTDYNLKQIMIKITKKHMIILMARHIRQ